MYAETSVRDSPLTSCAAPLLTSSYSVRMVVTLQLREAIFSGSDGNCPVVASARSSPRQPPREGRDLASSASDRSSSTPHGFALPAHSGCLDSPSASAPPAVSLAPHGCCPPALLRTPRTSAVPRRTSSAVSPRVLVLPLTHREFGYPRVQFGQFQPVLFVRHRLSRSREPDSTFGSSGMSSMMRVQVRPVRKSSPPQSGQQGSS